jgi:hypothetical protein
MMLGKYYWIAFLVLLIVHSVVAVGGYQLFVRRTRLTPEGSIVAATAREVRESRKAAYGYISYQLPLPVVLYVLLGYVALFVAAGVGILCLARGHSGFSI